MANYMAEVAKMLGVEMDNCGSFTDEEIKTYKDMLARDSLDTGINIFDDYLWKRCDDIKIPYLIINCPEEYPPPLNKKITISGKHINPNNPEQNFTFSDATLVRRIKEEQNDTKRN